MRDGAMSVDEAVAFSGISRRELYRLMKAGRLPYVAYGMGRDRSGTTGRRRLIPRRMLVEFLARRVKLVEPPAVTAEMARHGPRGYARGR